MNTYDGKLVFITGGSSGIGLALAKNLAGQGAHVWIMARRPDLLEAACREITAARKRPDQRVGTLCADIADRERVFSLLGEFIHMNGAPDYLINSAGITEPGLFADQPIEDFDRLMAVNYTGTVNVIKAVLPGMLKRGSGHIAIVGSGAGIVGLIGYSAYGATKFALRGLADVLRVELKNQGVKVSYIAPADTDTPQVAYEKNCRPAITSEVVGSNSKLQTPEHVAEVMARDIARGRYMITPGAEVTLYYYLTNTFGIVYPIMDFVVNQAWKKVYGSNHNGHK